MLADSVANVIFILMATSLGAMMVANVAIVAARLTHNDNLATAIQRVASRFVWVFRLGASPRARNDNRWA